MGDAVQVKGADRLARTMGDAADNLGDLSDVNTEAGDYLTGRAAAAAPRRTGRLAASLRAVVDTGAVVVGSTVVYAAPVHWGVPARNIPANPFITRTLTANETVIVGMYQRNNERVLDSIHGI